MTHPQLPHDEEDLMKTWQSLPGSAANPAQLARQMSERVAALDRRTWWRNAREYAACLMLLIWTSGGVREGNPAAMLMAAVALGLIGIRWWAYRGNRSLDPGADARTYHAALLKRYDDRIALMTSAKYWCAVPLYLPVIVVTWARWAADPQRAALLFATATAGFVVMWWLSDRYGVRKLKERRARAAAMFDAAE